jgi:DNA-binding response OmpR family regulator
MTNSEQWVEYPISPADDPDYFPAVKVKKASQPGGPARAAFKRRTNSPPRILVVDDNVDIRWLNTEVLAEAGYKVDVAGDGAVAWSALKRSDYALLITDHAMPVVSGVDLIMKLRAENMKLPVILMSSTIPTEVFDRHVWLQVQATLVKPYSVAELLTTVKKVLQLARSSRAPVTTPQNWQRFLSAASSRTS